ncbi:multidrug ABC transporter ATP-binding protein [Catellatospora sp. TT07R-123]|uniref:ABC transporter ATP-binding protein n=1 Tax=Catellatospora sp. TT07R-123 TaxID=2733863 RepID=UPI001B247E44|nr:ABC transporter ATP-binding protein [Catellatospora sp. TT07R-123]GHJ47292.1 multidrug ABC transporter ATP-binding protein [Catellatospora sp. TT07R-123]
MSSTDAPAIVLDAVSKTYGEVRAVDSVSLTVGRGEFFGLLGPNGAGKTTLIEMVEGLRVPDSGSVSVLGMSPAPRNLALLPLMGVQTQRSAFFTRLTAREHLTTVAALYGLPAAAADKTLAMVGLTASANVRVTNISGGQRQRLAIASALVHDPQVIFLDEPTAALDPQARRDLGQMLRELKATGKTIVYTTHHLDEAQGLCDRVAIMAAGSVLALGSPRDLIARSQVGTRLIVPASRLAAEDAGRLDGVDGVTVEDGTLVLRTSQAARVLAALGASGGLDDVETRPATLEDVYLELMGAPRA